MKKNLMTVVILVLVLANLVLTAILTISILPQTKKANELITQVCAAIDLEVNGVDTGQTSSTWVADIPIDQVATYDITDDLTIELKDSGDGKKHYAVLTVSLSMDTENEDYKTYGESIADRDSLIRSEINDVVSGFTYEEFRSDEQAVRDAILTALQNMFNSDFIFKVSFPKANSE